MIMGVLRVDILIGMFSFGTRTKHGSVAIQDTDLSRVTMTHDCEIVIENS